MRGNGKRLDQFAQLVARFRLGESMSVSDAAEKTGVAITTAQHQIERLHDTGLLRVSAWRKHRCGPAFPVYGWAEPFGQADVERKA